MGDNSNFCLKENKSVLDEFKDVQETAESENSYRDVAKNGMTFFPKAFSSTCSSSLLSSEAFLDSSPPSSVITASCNYSPPSEREILLHKQLYEMWNLKETHKRAHETLQKILINLQKQSQQEDKSDTILNGRPVIRESEADKIEKSCCVHNSSTDVYNNILATENIKSKIQTKNLDKSYEGGFSNSNNHPININEGNPIIKDLNDYNGKKIQSSTPLVSLDLSCPYHADSTNQFDKKTTKKNNLNDVRKLDINKKGFSTDFIDYFDVKSSRRHSSSILSHREETGVSNTFLSPRYASGCLSSYKNSLSTLCTPRMVIPSKWHPSSASSSLFYLKDTKTCNCSSSSVIATDSKRKDLSVKELRNSPKCFSVENVSENNSFTADKDDSTDVFSSCLDLIKNGCGTNCDCRAHLLHQQERLQKLFTDMLNQTNSILKHAQIPPYSPDNPELFDSYELCSLKIPNTELYLDVELLPANVDQIQNVDLQKNVKMKSEELRGHLPYLVATSKSSGLFRLHIRKFKKLLNINENNNNSYQKINQQSTSYFSFEWLSNLLGLNNCEPHYTAELPAEFLKDKEIEWDEVAIEYRGSSDKEKHLNNAIIGKFVFNGGNTFSSLINFPVCNHKYVYCLGNTPKKENMFLVKNKEREEKKRISLFHKLSQRYLNVDLESGRVTLSAKLIEHFDSAECLKKYKSEEKKSEQVNNKRKTEGNEENEAEEKNQFCYSKEKEKDEAEIEEKVYKALEIEIISLADIVAHQFANMVLFGASTDSFVCSSDFFTSADIDKNINDIACINDEDSYYSSTGEEKETEAVEEERYINFEENNLSSIDSKTAKGYADAKECCTNRDYTVLQKSKKSNYNKEDYTFYSSSTLTSKTTLTQKTESSAISLNKPIQAIPRLPLQEQNKIDLLVQNKCFKGHSCKNNKICQITPEENENILHKILPEEQPQSARNREVAKVYNIGDDDNELLAEEAYCYEDMYNNLRAS